MLAGLGAGLGTGFAGMSAAAVISPMLITFLGMDSYMAVGIALASDVLASAASAITYGKNKNLDIKNGLIMMIAVLCLTLVGSFVASVVPKTTMGSFSVFMTLLLGVNSSSSLLSSRKRLTAATARQKAIRSVICGAMVGFICGFIGAGGGMMMLLVLTSVLGYELKTAVGNERVHHERHGADRCCQPFVIGGAPDLTALIVCVASTLFFAQVAALFANKAQPKTLNRITGAILVILGAAILAVNYFG